MTPIDDVIQLPIGMLHYNVSLLLMTYPSMIVVVVVVFAAAIVADNCHRHNYHCHRRRRCDRSYEGGASCIVIRATFPPSSHIVHISSRPGG